MNEQLKSSQIREFVTKWLKNSKSGAIEKGEAADLPADALLGDAAEVPGRLHLVHAGVARLVARAAEAHRDPPPIQQRTIAVHYSVQCKMLRMVTLRFAGRRISSEFLCTK